MKTLALIFAIIFALTGCESVGSRSASSVAEKQLPGTATGAGGATLTGPTNSAQPSTQTSVRQVGYYRPPQRQWPLPTTGVQPAPTIGPNATAETVAPPAPESPPIAWEYERTETSLGAHQDAAAIMKVAATMGRWNKVQWIGLVCVVLGIGGLLWSAGHNEGYPLVFVQTTGLGLFLVIFCENPWWVLVLIVPLGLYAAQKMRIINLP